MSPPDLNGESGGQPDASSIRPVSSLLARFETLGKPNEQSQPPLPQLSTSLPPSQPTTSRPLEQGSSPAPSRPISPRPKPDRLRDFKSLADPSLTPTTTPTTPIKTKPPLPQPSPAPNNVTTKEDKAVLVSPALPLPHKPIPQIKSKPVSLQTPAVTVEPPQSPPKRINGSWNESADQSPFLVPAQPAAADVTTPTASPKVGRIPSRPITPIPTLSPSRSPRLTPSQPPSPPPPRRSGELRRDDRPKQPPPPPAPRGQSNRAVSSKLAPLPVAKTEAASNHTSPFGSPPGTPESPDDEIPPELPSRPDPRGTGSPIRHPAKGAFEQPPVHYAVADARRSTRHTEPEHSGRGAMVQRSTVEGEPRPVLPTRPQATEVSRRPSFPVSKETGSAASKTLDASQSHAMPPPKRISSNPTQQLVIPSAKSHERSKTLDRAVSPATPIDIRASASAAPKPISSSTSLSTSPVKNDPLAVASEFPDGSSANRRPPFIRKGAHEIPIKHDTRVLDVCGKHVGAVGQLSRIWSVMDGELVTSFAHTEGVKATAICFKPGLNVKEEGEKFWVGTSGGDVMEIDVATQTITPAKPNIHGRLEVIQIHRHIDQLWSLDEGGTLHVWMPDSDGLPNVSKLPVQTFKTARGHTFSMVVGDELWHATGKEIRVFLPTIDARTPFQVLIRPLSAEGAGEVTSGTLMRTQPDKVFFGHSDGKISIFSIADYTCLAVINVSHWKINALVAAGQYMWVGYNTGKICVYEVSQTPWVILKEWQAHDNPVVRMKLNSASTYQLDQLQVVTLGADNKIKLWDGLLQDDWLEDEMKSKDTTYCNFDEIKALVFTWNAGASTPHSLRYSGADATFFQALVQSSESPDILVFGFQELVDLEDKTATAKRLLKGKKKENSDQERMSHQYRDWRDFLMKTLDDYMPADDLYHLLHSAPLVGLFTCIFVKSSLRARIRNMSASEVKRGMGGVYGNKGAVIIRFQVDDSSLCFVNCHLAAGQSQANSRNNDLAGILEASAFPSERDAEMRIDSYTGGGDGSMIIDHELCILSGDLNYRIDTMSRDTVVGAVKQGNLTKLLDRDQLLVARRRNPTFKLRAFEELPITFAPTYKYDVGTDRYDTSEKRRSPAWCDRILFRGRGRVQQLDYLRHEIRVSDHRPVTGDFRMWVKKVDAAKRAKAWMETQQSFEAVRVQEMESEKLHYLTKIFGYDEETSRKLVKRS